MTRLLGLLVVLALAPAGVSQPDVFSPIRFLEGRWQGTSSGKPGNGATTREYRFELKGRFLTGRNRAEYAPTGKNPQGEVHEDMSVFSYDRRAKRIVLRQFHAEGFVNEYALESSPPDPKQLDFVTTRIENIPEGWRARETYKILGPDEFIEIFSLAAPGGEFEVYSESRLKRVR